MTKIIELAHNLGMEIAKSEEIKRLNETKNAFDADAELQAKMSEYEADRILLGQEFSKPENEIDEKAIADLRARIEELTREIHNHRHEPTGGTREYDHACADSARLSPDW